MHHSHSRRAAVVLAALLLPPSCVFGAVDDFKWDDHTSSQFTSANGYSQSYMIDGMMVNVTVGGTTSALTTTTSGGTVQTPVVTTAFEGGTNPVANSLLLAADFANKTDTLQVTVSFLNLAGTAPQAVTGIHFVLFDVDLGSSGTYIDQIRGIQGTTAGGGTLYPTTVTGTSGGNAVAGSGAGLTITGTNQIVNAGAGSNGANASIDFGSQSLTSFTFSYGNSPSLAQANPGRQVIAFHDFQFTNVPEPGTEATATIAGGLLVIGCLHRRNRALSRK